MIFSCPHTCGIHMRIDLLSLQQCDKAVGSLLMHQKGRILRNLRSPTQIVLFCIFHFFPILFLIFNFQHLESSIACLELYNFFFTLAEIFLAHDFNGFLETIFILFLVIKVRNLIKTGAKKK